MTDKHREMIRQFSRPLAPIPTSQTPRLRLLDGLRAVMFDIYGTLLISGCGDIGISRTMTDSQNFVAAMAEFGIEILDNGETGLLRLHAEIAVDHRRQHDAGVEYPEVDIVEVWRRTINWLSQERLINVAPSSLNELDFRNLALAYELRANPVWPMPHADQCLGNLQRMGFRLGLISNAQFMTIELMRSLIQSNPDKPDEFWFDEELQFYSFQHRRAKPGLDLFQMAANSLASLGIAVDQVLYVGNDMLNDIMPAQTTGFRTALFAGDARSLRLRDDDLRVAGVSPDIVITDLLDIEKCIR